MAPTITVHFGDMHVGSSIAVWPGGITFDDGGSWVSSALQTWYLDRWHEFWADTWALKRKLGAHCVGICGGDERDGDHHGTTQLVVADEADQDRAVIALLEDHGPADVLDEWHFVRGTRAHEGPNSAATERYALVMAGRGHNVVPNKDRMSHWVYKGVQGGVKIEVAHAPGTKSWVPHTQGVACSRHAQYTIQEYRDSGFDPPDVVIRHHVHYWSGPGSEADTCCFFVPAWQAPSSYVLGHGVKSGVSGKFVCGGLRLICENGRYTYNWWRRRPAQDVPWE